MQNLLKITLLTGAMAAAINAPVSAGNQLSGLRGMFTQQAAVSEFEGRYVQPKSHNMSWQQKRLQAPQTYAQPSQHSSQHYNNSVHRTAEDNYGIPEYSGRFGYSEQRNSNYSRFGSRGPKKSTYGNVYDYESGHCGKACAPAPVRAYYQPVAPQPAVTYRQVTQYKCWDGAIVNDYNGCSRQTVTKSIPQYRCWDGEVVTDFNGCKRETITRQVKRMSSNTHHSSSAYSTPTNCPSGTTAQSDGTCLETGYSGYSAPYTEPYSSPYTGASIELFGANTTAEVTPSYGYTSDNSYGLRSSLPKRK